MEFFKPLHVNIIFVPEERAGSFSWWDLVKSLAHFLMLWPSARFTEGKEWKAGMMFALEEVVHVVLSFFRSIGRVASWNSGRTGSEANIGQSQNWPESEGHWLDQRDEQMQAGSPKGTQADGLAGAAAADLLGIFPL